MTTSTDNSGVIARPPLLYLLALIAFFLLRWQWPLPIASQTTAMILAGIVLGVLSIGLGLWGRATLLASGTNVDPKATTTAIVTDGPYRFTRNPIYVALAGLLLGFTLGFDDWWGVVVLVPLLAVMHVGVILREESYLERKFGDGYRQYKVRVARYLG
jgi:protein-S-isoprenylcysteine O-methyltransferase Ste14